MSDPDETKSAEKKKRKRPKNFDKVLRNLDKDEIAVFADLGAGSANLATQIYKRYDSQILIIPVNNKGEFDAESQARSEKYIKRLEERGVDLEQVQIADASTKIEPVDVISTIGTFGDQYGIRKAKSWLDKLMGAESRWVTDIKGGSGGYGLAKSYGNAHTLQKFEEKGNIFARCVVSSEPIETEPLNSKDIWKAKTEEIIGEDGFYCANEMHSFTFIKRSNTLVVTFDNLDVAMQKRGGRLPWGYSFIEKQNFSMLGVMADGWTWYRDPWVYAQFDRLRDEGFFDQFEQVVFYGASMGGYAALAFAPAAKNARAVAFAPQSTLDKAKVPWETRYKTAWGRDFSGEYGDAAETAQKAEAVYLFYDPYQPLDAGHAKRVQGPNIHHYHATLMGHKVGTNFLRMGVLQDIVLGAINGTLTPAEFQKYMQARKTMRRYLVELLNKAKDKKHYRLALTIANYASKNDPNDAFFSQHAKELSAKLER